MPIPEKKTDDAPKTARERVYSTVRDWIIDGTLLPGEKIFDKDIAEYFLVSRTPVREAFQLLEDQKLLVISPGKESRVAPIDILKTTQSYEILANLETLALRYAMPNFTKETCSSLSRINRELLLAIKAGDARKASELDRRFHELILKLSGNDFLLNFCFVLEVHVARVEILYFSAQKNKLESLIPSVNEHDEIISAVEKGDVSLAEQAMKKNWLNTISLLEKLVEKSGHLQISGKGVIY